jgi:hypothetical protein
MKQNLGRIFTVVALSFLVLTGSAVGQDHGPLPGPSKQPAQPPPHGTPTPGQTGTLPSTIPEQGQLSMALVAAAGAVLVYGFSRRPRRA